jgi:hypothetical protein
MIRKVAVGLLTLAGLATLVVAMVSKQRALHWDASRSPQSFLPPGRLFYNRGVDMPVGERWTHVIAVNGHATLLYSARFSPPYALLPHPRPALMEGAFDLLCTGNTIVWLGPPSARRRKLDSAYWDERTDFICDATSREFDENLGDARFLLRHTTTPRRQLVVRVPLLPLSAAFLAYPAFVVIRGPARRWRRCKRGLCVKCGYSLTGLTEARCPECGAGMERSRP